MRGWSDCAIKPGAGRPLGRPASRSAQIAHNSACENDCELSAVTCILTCPSVALRLRMARCCSRPHDSFAPLCPPPRGRQAAAHGQGTRTWKSAIGKCHGADLNRSGLLRNWHNAEPSAEVVHLAIRACSHTSFPSPSWYPVAPLQQEIGPRFTPRCPSQTPHLRPHLPLLPGNP